MLIIQLHRTRTPFSIIISNEICGEVHCILYQDRYLRCVNMSKYEIRWFSDNKQMFRCVVNNKEGRIYEYKQFRKKISEALKHNFLVRNKIITSGYI